MYAHMMNGRTVFLRKNLVIKRATKIKIFMLFLTKKLYLQNISSLRVTEMVVKKTFYDSEEFINHFFAYPFACLI
jgi:hypothetical protein